MADLAAKTAIVTGGGSGLGRAIALAFAREGARVVVSGRRLAALEETAATARRDGYSGRVSCIPADLTSEPEREMLIQRSAASLGGVDVLVNSAGILVAGGVESTDLESWDRTMEINLRSVFDLTRRAAPHLCLRRGNIINISSVAGPRPYPGLIAYCVSKAAVDQLTRCIALDLAPKGVRANAINPGVVVTDLHRAGGMPEADYARFLEKSVTTHPLGRVGSPQDVAELALFLASGRAGWITGGTFSVDGGRALASAR